MVLYMVAAGFGLVAIGLLAAAAIGVRQVLQLTRYGLRSRATVRELKTRQLAMRSEADKAASPDDPVYAPLFEFATPDGLVHRIEGDASSPPRYRVGDEVSVLFDPADPGGARVETFAGLWLGVLLTTLGGGLTSLVALFILWLALSGP